MREKYPDLYDLREGQPIDYPALRAALVVTADSERLIEAVQRDMRIAPVAYEKAQQAAEAAHHDYSATCGVSVIVPCHNYAQFVTQALDSVLAQTRQPEDIIVIDDASTDNSREVIQNYIQAHPRGRIELISNAKNLDLCETQNVGIRAATQEHIICLDADDMIEPAYIETLHEAMLADRSLGVAYSGVRVLREGQIYEPPDFPAFNWEWMATPNDPPLTCIPKPAMFRRAMWKRCGGFQQTYRAGEDVDFWMRGLATGFDARKVTPERLFTYRVHGAQQMSKARKFTRIDHYKPWMRDGKFPFAAPAKKAPAIPDYSQPEVSVIIPVGPGHEKLVPSALESLLGQTCRAWEAIVVRDTPEALPLEAYPFARVIEGGCQGVANARNVGIEAARGRLICFLDADDWLEPFTLQRMVGRYAAGDAGYVYGDWMEVAADGTQTRMEASEYVHDLNHARGYYGGITVVMAKVDAQRIGGFDDSANGLEDWDFFVRCAINGICGARVAVPTFAYRKHTGKRRAMSAERAGEISAIFAERYSDYRTGVKKMSPCCGGNGDATLAAKRAIRGLPDPETPPSGELVQMEYIGNKLHVTYFGRYIGGEWPEDRHAHDARGQYGVDPRDVEKMANTGQWRVVESIASAAPEPKVSETMLEPEVQAKIERAEEIEALQDIQALVAQEDIDTVCIPFMQEVDAVKDSPTVTITVTDAPEDGKYTVAQPSKNKRGRRRD